MAATPVYLVMDAGTPVAAFTNKPELKVYLRRRLDIFVNPLVYTFWGNQGPSIMTHMAKKLKLQQERAVIPGWKPWTCGKDRDFGRERAARPAASTSGPNPI
jgi:hypothetical protein